MNAPVVVFAYNRPDKIKRCLDSLSECDRKENTDLFMFLDGPRSDEDIEKIKDVESFLEYYSCRGGFHKSVIIKSKINKGLKKSIVEGVTKIINEYGKVIVLEDDLIVAPDFLAYMNDGLDFYEKKKDYGSVCANVYPINQLKKYKRDIFVTRKGDCWGWGTWADRWEGVDWLFSDGNQYRRNLVERMRFESLESGLDKLLMRQIDGKGSSWAVIWIYSLYKRKLLSVYPRISRTANVGNDGSGEHGGTDNKYNVELSKAGEKCFFEDIPVDKQLERSLARYPGRHLKDLPGIIIRKAGRIIKSNQ